MTDITERYNQEIESTIQYDISELLHTDLSDDLKERLMNLGNPTVDKFIALFPIQDKIKFSTIRDALNGKKVILPKNLFEETKDEVTEICDDYKWLNSKNGKLILKIEEWIKDARHCIAIDFPSEYIYIGRSLFDPISLIVGGYVKELNTKTIIESCLDNMNPPIDIEYRIVICD